MISPNTCAHIETTKDWVKELGPTTALDSDCKSDLTDPTSCDACFAAGLVVTNELIAIAGNTSQATDCFYFAVLYAAGIVNAYGPESNGVMKCAVGLKFNSEEGSGDKGHSELVFGLKGAGVAVVVMSCLLGMYLWYDWRRKKGEGSNLRYGHDLEEQWSQLRVRPNTGQSGTKLRSLRRRLIIFRRRNLLDKVDLEWFLKGP